MWVRFPPPAPSLSPFFPGRPTRVAKPNLVQCLTGLGVPSHGLIEHNASYEAGHDGIERDSVARRLYTLSMACSVMACSVWRT